MDRDYQTARGRTPEICRFGDLSLDVTRGVLRRQNGSEIALRPKTAVVLRHLAQRAGQVVPREELMEAVRPGVFVSDDSITQCVGPWCTDRRRVGWGRMTRGPGPLHCQG